MMRTLAIAILLATLGAGSSGEIADARVVMTPTIPRSCPSGKTWDKVVACLGRFGKVNVDRELSGARLVRMSDANGFRVPGLYLYVEHDRGWRLAGMYETGGDAVELLAFQRITLAKHTGYRFDVGFTAAATSDVDSEIAVPAVLQQKVAVFCPGSGYFCSTIVTSCDLLVEGRSRASFRGALKFAGDTVQVLGDRSRTSVFCQTPESEPLGWAGLDRIDQ